jgi:hypothetical protein
MEEAYVRLLRSVIRRKKELFPSAEEVIAQWRLFDKALSALETRGFTVSDTVVNPGFNEVDKGLDRRVDGENTGVNCENDVLVKYPVGSNPEQILALHKRRQTTHE